MARLQITANTTSATPGARLELSCIGQPLGVFDDDVFDPGVFEEGLRGLVITANVDSEQADAIQPARQSGPPTQRVGWVVRFDGVDVTASLTPAGVDYEASIDDAWATASFTLYAPDDAMPISNSVLGAHYGGTASVYVGMRFVGALGNEFEVPLITDGVVDDSRKTWGDGGRVVEISVADRMRRYANAIVTRKFPAGSRLTRNRAVSILLADAGFPSISITGLRGRILRHLETTDAGFDLAQAIAEVSGGRVQANRNGTAVVRIDAPEATRPAARWTYTPADMLWAIEDSRRELFVEEPTSDAYTFVSMRGTKQVENDDGCAVLATPTGTVVIQTRTYEPLPYRQTAGASFSTVATSGAPTVKTKPTTEIRQITTTECGEILGELREVFGLYRREAARYTLDTTTPASPVRGFLSCYVEENAQSGPGYVDEWERFIMVQRERTARDFGDSGYLETETTEVHGWYNPRTAIKTRSDSGVSWESVGQFNYLVSGSDEGLSFSSEQFYDGENGTNPLGRTVKTYAQSNGYLTSVLTIEYGWRVVPGSIYLFGDGTEGGVSAEQFGEVQRSLETYESVDELRHRRVTITTPFRGRPVVESEIVQGQMPAAPKKRDSAPQREDFETDEDFAAAVAADRFDLREITAECSAPASLDRLTNELHEVSNEMAESESELKAIACRLLYQSMAPRGTFQTWANPRLDPGQWVRVVSPDGRDRTPLVARVRHSGPTLGPITTDVEVVLYPDAA